jgi:hypothetical protein
MVALSGTGVTPNLPPTAVITMQVPYDQNTIRIMGQNSFDPDGKIISYEWNFGDNKPGSSLTNPLHTFECNQPAPCLFVAPLKVTDNGHKEDPTSVTVISWTRELRSRFYGKIKHGGFNVRPGTVVEAWINHKKVAESLTQTHAGESVFAIEVPPDIHKTGDGGDDGDQVTFKYNVATALQSGTWYRATDQELNLTAPFYFPPLLTERRCVWVDAFNLEICGPSSGIPRGGINIELQRWPKPPPAPGPLARAGEAFRLTMTNAATGQLMQNLSGYFSLRLSYSDDQLAKSGVARENTLRLYTVQDGTWRSAGVRTLDALNNTVAARVNYSGVFAPLGARSGK